MGTINPLHIVSGAMGPRVFGSKVHENEHQEQSAFYTHYEWMSIGIILQLATEFASKKPSRNAGSLPTETPALRLLMCAIQWIRVFSHCKELSILSLASTRSCEDCPLWAITVTRCILRRLRANVHDSE
jgi:hypothetical protein